MQTTQGFSTILTLTDDHNHLSAVVNSSRALQENPLGAFKRWVVEHEKDYVNDQEEFTRRFSIWKNNVYFIQEYNCMYVTHWVRGLKSTCLLFERVQTV